MIRFKSIYASQEHVLSDEINDWLDAMSLFDIEIIDFKVCIAQDDAGEDIECCLIMYKETNANP